MSTFRLLEGEGKPPWRRRQTLPRPGSISVVVVSLTFNDIRDIVWGWEERFLFNSTDFLRENGEDSTRQDCRQPQKTA